MRNALVLGTILVLGLLVFVPASGTAAESDLVATSGIPTKLFGHVDATAERAILVFDHEAGALRLVSGGGSLERIRVTSSYIRLPLADVAGEQRVETETIGLAGGEVRIEPTRADAVIAASGARARLQSEQAYGSTPSKDLWTHANAQLSALIADQTVGAPLPSSKLAQTTSGEAPRLRVDEGTYALSGSGVATMSRADQVLVYGARLLGPDGAVLGESELQIHERAGGAYVPGPTGGSWVGPGTHVEETVEYFVLSSPDATVTGAGPATLYAADLRLHHTGYIGFPWAEGSLRTANETVMLSGQQVILGGDFWLRPIGFDHVLAPQITLLGDGDVHYVQIGASGRSFAPSEAAAIAGGTAAGLGLVALLVYFWPTLKYGLSLALFPLYARVPKENTLDHKGRELLYDLIKNEPGVSTNKLAKEVPFGWSTLTYHLRVLERNEAIVSVRDGRYKRFFDRQSGRFANGRKYILAVLKNDATYDIARFIREKPGSSQKEVATHFQLSPSSVHWHVERLSEVGLVSKAREAHNVKYNPGEAWEHVTMDDLKALGTTIPEAAKTVGASDGGEPEVVRPAAGTASS